MAALFHILNSFRSDRKDHTHIESRSTPRLGVALSSGGAKGLAHIGVIQVLEESGIPIVGIAGTSMGAYVGGLWASGRTGRELEALAAEMVSKQDLWSLVDPVFPPRRGFVRGQRILDRLEKTLQGKTFSELDVPFLAIATELETLERSVLREGNVASAIVSSLAVPGVVVPVMRDGIEYIDGGVSDPLPVRIARETWNLDAVIAVNVLPPVGSLRRPRQPRRKRGWQKGLSTVNRHLNYFARGNLLDTLRSAAMGSQMRLVGRSAKQADVLISALRPESGWHDYHNYRDYIEVGREAAKCALVQIEALLEPADLSHQSTKAS